MSPSRFAKLVDEAIGLVPPEFRQVLDNVAIVVEDEPADDLRADLGLADDETLFGFYSGTPLTERGIDHSELPDQIIIYRLPLTEEFPDPDELRREVARTVIHEIAHHFGIDEDRLTELGWQ